MRRYLRRIAPDPRNSPLLPRMVNEMHYDRVLGLMDASKVVIGGQSDRSDLYIEPTVMDGVSPQDPIMQEEVFGPVLPILTFRDLETLVETMKTQDAPLCLYIFSSHIKRAKQIMKVVPSGGGMINEVGKGRPW